MDLKHHKISEEFEKWYIGGLSFPAAFHRFTGADKGPAHDHPWGFVTHIISGGYVEEVFTPVKYGGFYTEKFVRLPGTSHRVEANTIHKIIHLLEPECVTLAKVDYVPVPRVWCHWEFRDGDCYYKKSDAPDDAPFIKLKRDSDLWKELF